jgi:hypothetical protein
MTRIVLSLLAIATMLFAGETARAQFPVTLSLDARNPLVVASPPTRPGFTYRITVSGTYSQWPQFADCHGVDAVWVYDVPQEEIDAFRWPPKEIMGRPFVAIPHWVGDTTKYGFPPVQLGLPPLFQLSFRDNLGFRVDNEPLPAFPIDRTLHRYQITKSGTGKPFSFWINDSTLVLRTNEVVPRYEDNCGSLTVVVEEIPQTDLNICDITPISVNGDVVGIRMDAGIFVADTTAVDGKRNILTTAQQIGIVVDGNFVCPDSLVCDPERKDPLHIGLVIDISGSMNETTLFAGKPITRLQALQQSVLSLTNKLRPGDSLFIITFNSNVRLALDWTADKARIESTVNGLFAVGGTSLHLGILDGLAKITPHPAVLKMLIVMTDGLNTAPPDQPTDVEQALAKANIPLYLIALGLGKSAMELEGIAAMKSFVRAAPTGKFYNISGGDELAAVYEEIVDNAGTEDCCRLYFRIPPCDRGQSKRTLRIVYVNGEELITTYVDVACDLRTTGVVESPSSSSSSTDAQLIEPLPADDIARIWFDLDEPQHVVIQLFSLQGELVQTIDAGIVGVGHTAVELPVHTLTQGHYMARIRIGEAVRTTPIIIQR